MILYLSLQPGYGSDYILQNYNPEDLNVLTSFQYKAAIKDIAPSKFRHFMADSGAFTAMNAGIEISGNYIDQYIAWVKKFRIKNYIEMDLDEIVGYEEVKKIRNYIEKNSNDIYEVLKEILNTEDIAVHIEAKHSCMTARGIKNHSALTVTNKFSGEFQKESWQHEFLQSLK